MTYGWKPPHTKAMSGTTVQAIYSIKQL